MAADRESPGGSVGDLLAGLRAARSDADRAAALAARVRWRLSATEDRLRRTRKGADAVAARHFGRRSPGSTWSLPGSRSEVAGSTVRWRH
ncbi:hypothetical protein NKG94_47955 [Micromonospora sp. M12]